MMEYSQLKKELLREYILTNAPEDRLRMLDKHFKQRIDDYVVLRNLINKRLKQLVQEDIKKRGG